MCTKVEPISRMMFTLFLLFSIVGCRERASAEPDPKNELPFGYVDLPAPGAMVERDMPARGWALDDGSVREVRVFVDSHFVSRADISENRPDVTKAYPKYANGTDMHGWGVLVPIGSSAAAGPHTILVQAVDNQGATRDIGTVYVTISR